MTAVGRSLPLIVRAGGVRDECRGLPRLNGQAAGSNYDAENADRLHSIEVASVRKLAAIRCGAAATSQAGRTEHDEAQSTPAVRRDAERALRGKTSACRRAALNDRNHLAQDVSRDARKP